MKRTLALVLVLVMALALFAGCTDSAEPTKPAGDDANKVTVTWYVGSKELKSEKVEKGSKVATWTPTDGDKEFVGWYAEASLTQEFDFDAPINADTDIFAAFKSNEYVEDTNNYYAIGTGAGDMGQSSWDHAKSEANLAFTKDTAITDKNVYKLTLKMYAGDGFQICFGGDWNGQMGIGYMVGAEYADGVNKYDSTEYTAADKKYAEVKDADGNVIFNGSDEYNKGFEVWNIFLAEGQDGIYEFTFTTYPANSQYNTLEWKLVEKIDALASTHEMHMVGTFNEWNAADENTEYHMTKSEDGKTWTGFLTVGADGAECKVVNQINEGWYSPDGNNIVLTEGTYCIKYTVEGDKVEVQKLDYYVVGTFVDAEGNAVNFSIKEGVTPKLENGTVTFEAKDVTALGDYSWMKDQGKPGVMAIKVVFGCELGIKDWYSDEANNGDNWYVNAGSVTVTLADGIVTVTQ